MINVGFIGCGAMGRDHVRRITDKCGNAQVVGVYDTVLGNAKQPSKTTASTRRSMIRPMH